MKKSIGIIACPRSGTGYASKLFSLNGIDVGHEEFGRDGISSWVLVSMDNKSPWGPSYIEVIEKYPDIIFYHQVRNPLDAIASLTTILPVSMNFASKYIPIKKSDNVLKKCMKFWLYWNLRAEELTQNHYLLQNIMDVFTGLIPIDDEKVNSRSHNLITLDDLRKEDKKLCNKILEKYGEYSLSKSFIAAK